ncbi:MAG: 50S ribosomal protein L9 [Phycisphaerales bacterium]|nr:50S ribosomal protein L9 [Phycisphaerales bacterium]
MANVKLLLRESIRNVGRVGDVVEVSPGYARNFLLPRNLAVQPTASNIKRVEERRKEIERQERELREQQAALIKQLEGVEVALERRANERGHLFGSVNATDISNALQLQGFNIEPDDIYLHGKIDRIERFVVTVSFSEDLKSEIKIYVAPDADSKSAMEAYAKQKAVETPENDQ